jgi:hypothetical protein
LTGETATLAHSPVETIGAENIVTTDADHEMPVENKLFAAMAFLLGGEKIIFHFLGHKSSDPRC